MAGTCYVWLQCADLGTSLTKAQASGQQIEALLVLANQDYQIKTWQTALLAWAVVALAILFNTFLYRKLPIIEGLMMLMHVFGFFAFIVVLWSVSEARMIQNPTY